MSTPMDRLAAAIPGYARHWRPRPGGGGYALLRIVSRYAALVAAARDEAVAKGELAFFDALGIDLLPPQAARAPIAFEVAPDTPVDPGLPAGTQVAGGDPVVFATEQAVTLARGRLTTVYSALPGVDEYADHSAELRTGFRLYEGMRPVAHELYLGHDELLRLTGEVDLTVELSLATDLRTHTLTKSGKPKQPRGLRIAWEYLTGEGWIAFDSVDDGTLGLSVSGPVRLHKRCGPASTGGHVDGVSSYWVRARMETPLTAPRPPLVDTVRLHLATRHSGLPCDAAFATNVRLDPSRDFAPYGPQPVVSSCFLIACDEAFRQGGARIGVSAAYVPGAASGGLTTFWEYSTGPGTWQALGAGDTELADHTAGFSKATTLDPVITFRRPVDWAKANVYGEEHYWLRVRVTAGGFGGPPTYSVKESGGTWSVVAANVPQPPVIRALTFSYATEVGPVVPDRAVTLNGFTYADVADPVRWGGRPFPPFTPLPDRYAAVHLGFDQPLPVGLVSLYVDVPGTGDGSEAPSSYLWEYHATDGWGDLTVLDETAGFARSGMVQFIGPADAAPAPGPTGPTYWVRARTRERVDPEPSPVDAVVLNAVWATQRTAVRHEVLGRGDGTDRQVMVAQHAPILAGQRLEVQEWHGTGRAWEGLFADVPADRLRFDRDPRGAVTAVWVTWAERPYLFGSRPGERHYSVERTTGLFRFGTADTARVVPPGATVMAGYDYGGGVGGNLPTGAIAQLRSGVPYLRGVGNVAAAAGGAAGEDVARVRRRGPERLRNAGYPVAPADYEWLAREASPEVAVARCLPATGPAGPGQPGWVTVVVVPQSGALRPEPSQQLLRTVRRALAARAPAAIAGQIRVVAPTYRPVSVVVDAVPVDPGEAAAVEQSIVDRLDAFLHAVRGGWAFGEAVRLSQVVRVVLATPGVRSAPHVALLSGSEACGDAVPLGPDALPAPGRHLVKLTPGVR